MYSRGTSAQAHPSNGTPYVAITSYVAIMFAIPTVLQIFTNPVTTFGDAGTLAAFGFLLAYFLITIAAPAVPEAPRRTAYRATSSSP